MSDRQDPEVSEIISQLIEAAPPAPTFPDLVVGLGPISSRTKRRSVIVAAAAGLAVVVGVVAVIALGSGSDRNGSVILRGGKRDHDPLSGRALPTSGVVFLEAPKYESHSTSYVPVLEDDGGTVLARLPRVTISSDVANDPWSVRLVASDSGVRFEHIPLPDQTSAPSGCSITAETGVLQVAVCGARSGDRVLGKRIVVNRGTGWTDLAASPPAPVGVTVTGHWAFAVPSPDTRWVIAQWSGECESPTAFVISVANRAVHTVTGEAATAWVGAPESGMLGWTSKSNALVVLPNGECGTSVRDAPGVYVVSPRDESRRLFRGIASSTSTLRWTSVDDRRTDVDLSAPTTTVDPVGVRSTGPTRPSGTDLVGGAPPILIDHTGVYTWQSEVVLPGLPGSFGGSRHVDGDAQISEFNDTLVQVPGGYAMRVRFNVDRFTGHPTLTLTGEAQGPFLKN